MRRIITLPLATLLWMLSVSAVLAQADPAPESAVPPMPLVPPVKEEAAMEQLRELLSRYGDSSSSIIQGRLITEGIPGMAAIEMPFVNAVERPDKVYMKHDHPQAGGILVSDGQKTWNYVTMLGQYTELDGSSRKAEEGGMIPIPSLGFGDRDLERAMRAVLGARVIENHTVSYGDESLDCRALELIVYKEQDPNERATMRLYLHPEEEKLAGLSMDFTQKTPMGNLDLSVTMQIDEHQLGSELDPALFVFAAPEGATKVEKFGAAQANDNSLEGQEAGDFLLLDMDGQEVRLSELRGKVVLLDFWASWCGPCKRELPIVEKLYKEYEGKDLVVLGVNSEPERNARRFLEKMPLSFPTLLDARSAVSTLYQVTAIPTIVVIDKQGTVASHFVGLRGEELLRQALLDAGLE